MIGCNFVKVELKQFTKKKKKKIESINSSKYNKNSNYLEPKNYNVITKEFLIFVAYDIVKEISNHFHI